MAILSTSDCLYSWSVNNTSNDSVDDSNQRISDNANRQTFNTILWHKYRQQPQVITHLVSFHLILPCITSFQLTSFRLNSLRCDCCYGELDRFTTHDPVRRGCDQSQRPQFSWDKAILNKVRWVIWKLHNGTNSSKRFVSVSVQETTKFSSLVINSIMHLPCIIVMSSNNNDQ